MLEPSCQTKLSTILILVRGKKQHNNYNEQAGGVAGKRKVFFCLIHQSITQNNIASNPNS